MGAELSRDEEKRSLAASRGERFRRKLKRSGSIGVMLSQTERSTLSSMRHSASSGALDAQVGIRDPPHDEHNAYPVTLDQKRIEIGISPSSHIISDDHTLVSLDLPAIEWEGYVTKRGHLVRNWKMRFFTLEGSHLSYYESKVDAQQRINLKGRVVVVSVRIEPVSKLGNGFDFSFETPGNKVFHCSVPTKLDQILWVSYLKAGIGCGNLKLSSETTQFVYRYHKIPDRNTFVAYELVQRFLTGNLDLAPDLLAYFNKDLVFTCKYQENMVLSGDYFGREGLCHFFGALLNNVDILEMKVLDVFLNGNGTDFCVKGEEKLRFLATNEVVKGSFTHHIQYGPAGRIMRLKVEARTAGSLNKWDQVAFKSPYSAVSTAAVRSNRSLSVSLKDFTVYNVIGKGGFGTVVNAVKKSDGQVYAIKILEKSKMTKYDIESSFTEMRVAQSIHHPFIAGLRIAFQSRTKLFLGMNFYGGGDLFHHMSNSDKCRLSPERAHFYTAELVLGIHHLHQQNILYRDIKPENVMVDNDGHIALVDFGLAKLHVSEFKGAKTMAGSPQYTAPELLLPKATRSYGKAADWWSLGVLLYEMNVGVSPFYHSNVEKMYLKIQNDELKFPEEPSLSEDLQDILTGFLQKNPLQRLGTCISDIVSHPYFADINWDLLLQKKLPPPWKPALASPLDVKYVDAEFTELDVTSEVQSPTDKGRGKGGFLSSLVASRSANKSSTIPAQDPAFKDFTYYCDNLDALLDVHDLVEELRPSKDMTASAVTEIAKREVDVEVTANVRRIEKTKSVADLFKLDKLSLSNRADCSARSVSSSESMQLQDTYLESYPNSSMADGTPLSTFIMQGHLCHAQESTDSATISQQYHSESSVETQNIPERLEFTVQRPFPPGLHQAPL